MSDNVNKPSHYNAGGVETIEGIEAALGDGYSDYCLGNVLKYVWRCKHKGKLVEDLRKAAKYLDWAIEAAEGNCPETPDSSSGKAIPIPEGWRELEPDEMPLATDMHEWMGDWFPRKDDATNTYIWHSRRHIRKIETLEPEPLAIPEGWRELEADEMPKVTDLYENEGVWRNRINDSSIEYARYEVRHIRKIEAANPSENPNSSIPDPLNCIDAVCDLAEPTGVTCQVDSCDLDTGCRQAPGDHIADANKKVPPAGYRLLDKSAKVEPRKWGDLFWSSKIADWKILSALSEQEANRDDWPACRKIETENTLEVPNSSTWIPKVGDKVRVNCPRRLSYGKIGVIAERDAGKYTVRILGHDLTSFNLTAEHLELIEAAS